jgi:hypothetical protein
MTRDNLRARGMAKPLECEMCKEIETIKHVMFECIVSRLLWDEVSKIVDFVVTDLNPLLPNGSATKSSYILI